MTQKKHRFGKAWMHEHVTDFYVRQAKEQGYRSRAAFKLLEIDEKDKLLRPGIRVVDLGCAPGGWCQVAADRLGSKGAILGVDLLEMPAVPRVEFIQGDFREAEILAEMEARLGEGKLDLVLSDMAPNISGVASADQARSVHLAELALEFAINWLRPGGNFLVKVFQGEGFPEFQRAMRPHFDAVAVRKPKASRDRSPEVYLLGRGFRPQ